MRIIIAGSRTVSEQDVRAALKSCPWIGFVSSVISGTAAGADTFGERWAEENKVIIQRVPAEWKKFGKRAGPVRNNQMAQMAEGLIAVWDGKSPGTYNMIQTAKDLGLNIFVFRTDSRSSEKFNPTGNLGEIWYSAMERAGLIECDTKMTPKEAERIAGEAVLRQWLDSNQKRCEGQEAAKN